MRAAPPSPRPSAIRWAQELSALSVHSGQPESIGPPRLPDRCARSDRRLSALSDWPRRPTLGRVGGRARYPAPLIDSPGAGIVCPFSLLAATGASGHPRSLTDPDVSRLKVFRLAGANSGRDGASSGRRATSIMSRKSDKRSRRSRAAAQAEFAFKINGGARPGSGRKRSGPRPLVPHRKRGRISSHVPALVTVRLIPGLASLRRSAELKLVRTAMRAANCSSSFGVVHYTIQSNHLHLIVEAHDRPALSAGMKGLLVRIARRLNRAWRRRGSIFADRYHVRALRTPREVRNALVYVLHNARRHGIAYRGADPFSSGPWFDGWADSSHSAGAHSVGAHSGGSRGHEQHPSRITAGVLPYSRDSSSPLPTTGELNFDGPELSRARSWLLTVGWKRRGLIGIAERPAAQEITVSRRTRAS